QSLRLLDDLRVKNGRLDFAVPVGDGGSLRVELNHSNMTVLPSGLQLGDNDSRILAVTQNLATDGRAVTIVSTDLPMRVNASSIGRAAEEYRAERAVDESWAGLAQVHVGADDMATLYETETLPGDHADVLQVNTGLVIHSERGSA